jgi:undecaprenyl-diphosphatase
MRWVTHLGGVRATVGAGLAVMAIDRRLGLAALLANAVSHLAVQVLKRTVARPRPCDAEGRPLALVELPDPFSFPSGHAAASAAVAVTLVIAYGWLAPLVLPIAALVGVSRVRLRVHHAGDVVAGAALGVAGALAAAALLLP